ncbi:aldose 1-epimerase [soil metagenome]
MTTANSTSTNWPELRAGALRLALRHDLGGVIAGLWPGDDAVMRSTEPGQLERVRLGACYPLLPFSNRVGYRQFNWQGKTYHLQKNVDDSEHTLHGVAWQQPWTVERHDESTASLLFSHADTPEATALWPFPFDARQTFTLTAESLEVQLEVTNRASIAAPMGLGWHPYFPKRERSRLHAELDHRWDSDETTLPVHRVEQPSLDSDISHLDFDNVFEGWVGSARIRDERLSLRLSSSLHCLVIYTPQTKPYFAVEPVSHVSNALNMPDPEAAGIRTLQPGQTITAWMKLDVLDAK